MKRLFYTMCCAVILASCAIRNDIPYPIVEGSITAFEVEGQRGETAGAATQATINTKTRTVTLYVDDSVDLTQLRITKLTISDDTELLADSAVCKNYSKFPHEGFDSVDDLPTSSDTRINFSSPVKFTLRTYQDYEWTVTVTQVIDRRIDLQNQVGDAVIDTNTRTAIIYVAKDQPLDKIAVTAFDLGGEHGSVDPDPTGFDTFDFSTPREFYVCYGWEEVSYKWTVYVYHDEDGSSSAKGTVFPMATRATVSGSIQSGKTPVVEYKKQADAAWTTLAASAVTVSGTSYTASLSKLTPGTAYQLRVNVDGTEGEATSFTTAPATPLTNGSLDNWSQDGKVWIPNAADENDFWGTGNPGSTILNSLGNITTPTDESVKGKAALLETKFASSANKLAAGNLFTGDFQLDGMDGLLHFGRAFTSFPTGLKLHYKYTSTTINYTGDNLPAFLQDIKGEPDTCFIYIALSDKSTPYEIRNKSSNRQLFDKNDANIIAYGEFSSAQSTTGGYQELTIPLVYRATNRTPKYIIVVATSSKYGDYYVGGEGSTLWLDELELLYE